MHTAVVAGGRVHLRENLGVGDNNDAEWQALIDALGIVRSLGARDVVLLGDSAMVVSQASGIAPCRDARFHQRLAEYRALADGFHRLRIRRIARSQNLAGIALERMHGKR